MSEPAGIFDSEAEHYDRWFETPEGRVLFANELQAIRLLWRDEFRPALEVGVGTGRFAQALGVESGIDPAPGALRLARQRGLRVEVACGEALPFASGSLGGVLLLTTLCFAADARTLLREAARVLRPGGHLLVGDIPADSPWGREYLRKKAEGHPYYRSARFYTVDNLMKYLREAGFAPVGFASTLVRSRPGAPEMEPAQPGLVPDAGFVCILAQKP